MRVVAAAGKFEPRMDTNLHEQEERRIVAERCRLIADALFNLLCDLVIPVTNKERIYHGRRGATRKTSWSISIEIVFGAAGRDFAGKALLD